MSSLIANIMVVATDRSFTCVKRYVKILQGLGIEANDYAQFFPRQLEVAPALYGLRPDGTQAISKHTR